MPSFTTLLRMCGVHENSVSIIDPRFSQYNGTFSAPFNEKSWFGKLSWQANENNTIDLSYSDRKDKEILGFGGTTTYQGRTERNNDIETETRDPAASRSRS